MPYLYINTERLGFSLNNISATAEILHRSPLSHLARGYMMSRSSFYHPWVTPQSFILLCKFNLQVGRYCILALHGNTVVSQQTRDVELMMKLCWPIVFDAGPTLLSIGSTSRVCWDMMRSEYTASCWIISSIQHDSAVIRASRGWRGMGHWRLGCRYSPWGWIRRKSGVEGGTWRCHRWLRHERVHWTFPRVCATFYHAARQLTYKQKLNCCDTCMHYIFYKR